jgi:hypothetical protein
MTAVLPRAEAECRALWAASALAIMRSERSEAFLMASEDQSILPRFAGTVAAIAVDDLPMWTFANQ